jgi:hypothetical protein
LVLLAGTTASANVTVTQVSHDIYTDAQAQHNTEVEPDTFVFGNTIVSAFQVGRVSGGGASNIGWATSTDGGATWTHGYLPGITTNGGGTFGQASDPSVAFDARHNVWMISSLGLSGSTVDVLVSRSTNGGLTWSNPVIAATGANDKNWTVCDDTSTSPHFGNCYTEYDITSAGDSIRMRTSTNGGASWGAALAPGGSPTGLGGQPVVLPNGHVVVPYESLAGSIRSFRSTNGGASWNSTVLVSNISHRTVRGSLREGPLPSAEADAAGTVYVTWADCRFRSGCPSNDIVLSKSTSETTWGAHPGPNRPGRQHRRPLHPRHRGGPLDLRRDCPDRPDVLLLPDRLLHGLDLPAGRRVHLVGERRQHLERGHPTGRADDFVLAAEHLAGQDGRRLYLHLHPGRRPRLPDPADRQRAHRLHLQPGDVYP